MAGTLVTGLVALLFLAVGSLLTYGAWAFRLQHQGSPPGLVGSRAVNMRREVLWTGVSAGLLLAVFVIAR